MSEEKVNMIEHANGKRDTYDREWVDLMLQAKQLAIKPEEVRLFLHIRSHQNVTEQKAQRHPQIKKDI